MKYCVLIIDGGSGLPLPERGNRTCLELARTPNLDAMAKEGMLGRARTVPAGMEPSSACACMSVLGYDPKVYYSGRAGIEARSMGIPIEDGEVVFRCNLVATRDGRMRDYSSGHISTEEARQLIEALNQEPGNDQIRFYPGISYRHICKIRGRKDTLSAICTPPHDIPDRPIDEYMPVGSGSELLVDLMTRSAEVLWGHPVNVARRTRGDVPVSMIWLFWGSERAPDMPPFKQVYGLEAAITSGVDLLHGLGKMMGMDGLEIAGVTDGVDNDNVAQVEGALKALNNHDLVVVHMEAPDEAAHAGSVEEKVEAIQRIDKEVVSRLRSRTGDSLSVLVMPDHPTPISTRTHSPEPVPFLLWGEGFYPNGSEKFTEKEAAKTGLFIDPGCNIMSKFLKRSPG
jgi:2,3-bisphosphoglycerate-independent phosphoglycerate mutase